MNDQRRQPPRPRRATLLDVAKDAGVSRATASLVLRKSPLVADATYEKVLLSMQRLGYVYNRAAASMRSNRSHTIGLIVTDVTNPFFAQMTLGCETHLNEKDYALLLGNSSDTVAKQDRLLATMHEYSVDGLLLCPAINTDATTIEQIAGWHLPCVQVSRYVSDIEADYLGPDNIYGAKLAVNRLAANGHKRIAFIGGPAKSTAYQERLDGYRSALADWELAVEEDLLAPSAVTTEGGRNTILRLMQLAQPPAAAFCYNDIVAHGVMLGLQSLGITPGEAFDVIGVDDIDEAAQWRPALTTVAMPPNVIGAEAARLLMERISHPQGAARHVILQPKLILRDSCSSR